MNVVIILTHSTFFQSVQIKDEPDETRENVDVTIDDDDDEPVQIHFFNIIIIIF